MADVNGYGINVSAGIAFSTASSDLAGNAPIPPDGGATFSSRLVDVARLSPGITYFYQMEATDASNNNIASWVVQGAPDFSATTTQAQAAISAAALNTPVRNVRIVTFWPTVPAG